MATSCSERLVACAAVLLFIGRLQASTKPPIADLELLRQVQRANLELYSSGQLDADVESIEYILSPERAVVGTRTTKVTCRMIWKDQSTYWEYELTESTDGTKPSQYKQRVQTCQDASSVSSYLPDVKLVQIRPRAKSDVRWELRLRPEQVWFAHNGATWYDLFGGNPQQPMNHVERYETKEIDATRFEVSTFVAGGGVAKAIISIPHGCNVVEHVFEPGMEQTLGSKARYSWRLDVENRPVLKEYHHEQWSKGRRRNVPIRSIGVMVTAFEPTPVIPNSRFTLEGLGIAPGDRIEDEITGRTYTFRSPAQRPIDIEAELRKLVDIVRSKGFSSAKP